MRTDKRTQLEHQLYIIGLCLPCVGVIVWILWQNLPDMIVHRQQIPCVFHAVTGLYCPGCGGTRAAAAFFKGKWMLSFCYHPIVVYGFFVYFWYMVSHTVQWVSKQKLRIGMRYREIYLWLALVIVVINAVVKNIALVAYHIDLLKLLDGIS